MQRFSKQNEEEVISGSLAVRERTCVVDFPSRLGLHTEEFQLGSKTSVWCFRPHHRQLQRLYLTSLTGECWPPHTRLGLVHSQSTTVSRTALGWPCSYTYLHSQARSLHSKDYLPGALNKCLQVLTSLRRWARGRKLKYSFPDSDVVLSTFPFLALSPCHPPSPREHKIAEAFCSRLIQQWDNATSALSHQTLNHHAVPREENGTGES